MVAVKVLPCPFCGAKPRVWKLGMAGHTVIECANYDVAAHRVYMQGDSEEEVIKAWNRRVDNDKGNSD